ncbi:DUF3817 domain-containing protein [Cryomorpha ignava]|uniref:DUF3817 domain-containing protein n=1 Tax=Cryomorpha ignava TaxID=101383 RepID=A0A7K3WKP0_9FLAO|nr:DUF3817 domain-containing protein [Cryomorpha ignava]NEN22216.1 DUF3817 domain-containing protein [Cryomorpha ignava]
MKLSQFIFIGRLEVLSFLVLLLIAMPMKYFMDFPLAVKYVGWAHGVLFMLYAGAIAILGYQYKWKFIRMFLLFISAFIPFGPILMEKRVLYNR